MKQVVNIKNQTTLSEIDLKKYYGFQMNSHSRGMLTREHYEEGKYCLLATSEFTKGNGWGRSSTGVYSDSNVKNLMEKCLSDGINIFEFDTFVELAKWAVKTD